MSFDNLGKWKQVVEYSIIRVKKYQYEEINGKRFIIIENYDIITTSITINLPNDRHTKTIGNPVPMNQKQLEYEKEIENEKENLERDLQVKIENLEKMMVSVIGTYVKKILKRQIVNISPN